MLPPPRPPLACCSYGPQWEAHVLSNLPFYLALLPLFLEAAVPRVEVRAAGQLMRRLVACWFCYAVLRRVCVTLHRSAASAWDFAAL